jgi:hypothetical protein
MKKLKILWSDNRHIDLILLENPLSDYYYRCIMRLKHIKLNFSPRENPLDNTVDEIRLKEKLINCFKNLNISIDIEKLKTQDYHNKLHDLYLDNFHKGKNIKNWLEVHDLIHMLENKVEDKNCLWFDYKELSGPLIQNFSREFLKYATRSVKKGYCYLSAHELGKTPIRYWEDKESNDIKNICKVVKPWLFLRPLIDVGIKDFESKKYKDPNFLNWFEEFKNEWCTHWNLKGWEPWEISANIPIGYIPDIDHLIDCFFRLDYPIKIIDY